MTDTVTQTSNAAVGERIAQYIADTLTLALGARPQVDGSTITLTADDLAQLAALPEDHDGHYDGKLIWVGGTDYLVRG
jgi:hypothetical protein